MRLAEHSDNGWHDSAGQPIDAPAQMLRDQVLNHTLIRRNEDPRFLAPGLPANRRADLALAEPLRVTLRRRQLPDQLPDGWQVREIDAREVEVTIPAGIFDVLLPDAQEPKVRAAADCLSASGLSWETLRQQLNPDHIAVYAGTAGLWTDAR